MAPILRKRVRDGAAGAKSGGCGSPRGFDRRVCMIVWPVWPVRHNSSEFGYKTAVFSIQARPSAAVTGFLDFELPVTWIVVFDFRVTCRAPSVRDDLAISYAPYLAARRTRAVGGAAH